MIKKCDDVNHTFTINEEYENKLLTVSNSNLMNDMTINNFYVIAALLMKDFIKVRMTEDLNSLEESDVPKRGELADAGNSCEPFLMQLAHEHRNK